MNAIPVSTKLTKSGRRLGRVLCFLLGLLLGSGIFIFPIIREEICNHEQGTPAVVLQLSTLQVSLLYFKTLNQELPTSEQGLKALYEPPESVRVRRKLIRPEAILDPWNKPFGYKYIKDHELIGFDLWSAGRDCEDYTEDDIIVRYRRKNNPLATAK